MSPKTPCHTKSQPNEDSPFDGDPGQNTPAVRWLDALLQHGERAESQTREKAECERAIEEPRKDRGDK